MIIMRIQNELTLYQVWFWKKP